MIKHLVDFQTCMIMERECKLYSFGFHPSICFALSQGVITQLSEQISTLNERMDEFTSRIEELNSKFSVRKVSASQQNLALQAETCNGSGPTSLFVTGLSNGSLTGSLLPNSSSSSQLAKESPLMEEVINRLITPFEFVKIRLQQDNNRVNYLSNAHYISFRVSLNVLHCIRN